MDGCSLNDLVRLARLKGAIVAFTPPYCQRANAIEPLFKGMNDYVRRNRELSRSDPAESLRLGLLHAGEHAFKYVQQSEKDVAGWLDGRGLYNA